jgi:hypothetical protein
MTKDSWADSEMTLLVLLDLHVSLESLYPSTVTHHRRQAGFGKDETLVA